MSSGGKTELQREILLTWYDNPNATNKEIAKVCDCSASYVSEVKNRFNDYDHLEVVMDREDKQIEEMFGEDIFAPAAASSGRSSANFAELWEETPNNTAGLLIKAIILLVLLYVVFEVAQTLFF
jgi:hypothetical protein